MKDEHISMVIRGAVAEAVTKAVAEISATKLLSDEEREWVRMAVKREARKEAFYEKIMQSTAVTAVWMLLAGVAGGLLIGMKEYMISHGMWRP
jgi:hypothetical protein